MPAFPLHGWMPAAYTNAPTPVVAVLSGVLSKVGAYGFLRIALPLFPDAAAQYQDLLLVIAVASILYGSVMAFTQTSATLVVGYSSIAQLGFITLGIFSLTDEGAQGAVLQMVNHGLVVVPLFFIIALLAERAGGTDDLRRMGGLALRAPVLAAVFLIVALATLAIPGSANFAGEFLILDRHLQVEDRVRDRGERRRRAGRGLHDPAVPALDAQPARARRRVARDEPRRRRGDRPDRGRDPVPRAVPAVRAGALRAGGADERGSPRNWWSSDERAQRPDTSTTPASRR